MSEYDEVFRQRLESVFEKWVDKLRPVLADLVSPFLVKEEIDKLAYGIIAMIEGGIRLLFYASNILTSVQNIF